MRRSDKIRKESRSFICAIMGCERNAIMRKENKKEHDKLIDVDIGATKHQKDLLRGFFSGNLDMSNLSYFEAQRLLNEMKEG